MEQAVELCAGCTEMETYLAQNRESCLFLRKTVCCKDVMRRKYSTSTLAKVLMPCMLIGDAIAGAASKCNDGALGSRLAYLRACRLLSASCEAKGSEETRCEST